MAAARPALEKLDLALVLLGGLARCKSSQVSAPACSWIDFSGVKAILSGFQLADHGAYVGCKRRASIRDPVRWHTRIAALGATLVNPGTSVR